MGRAVLFGERKFQNVHALTQKLIVVVKEPV